MGIGNIAICRPVGGLNGLPYVLNSRAYMCVLMVASTSAQVDVFRIYFFCTSREYSSDKIR